ncbi:fructosamine kinase family protein [Thalassotalea euphylliae]|uniref:Fructosamine kinase family protein n=1 Tax=Thalassotalea euphylliae TaxID=1655234 RepID=A0A3E0TX04_9GAMM|nr:fructosamine kinase family protein [Thalassotalea euphylliae]REL28873.1 fructosamine kinase family protein [Thalassotalea euphylliae]
MWHTIETAISESTGKAFSIQSKAPISGGDTNLAFHVSGNDQAYFVKVNEKHALASFEQEYYSLEQLSYLTNISSPKPVTIGCSLDKSFLVLEYWQFVQGSASLWYQLGQQLALMHQSCTHGEFGWQSDNFIGHTRQPNTWQKNWSMFFAEQRIGWQLTLLEEKSIQLGDIDHICGHCHDLLAHHHPEPSLLHGDLWQGNVGFTELSGVIYDPACYYGDREADIAMTELFGLFPTSFYQGYQATFPLSKRYAKRKLLYNFYHILNHANMFGGVYIKQAKANLHRILSLPS